jgi:hypothetical protein
LRHACISEILQPRRSTTFSRFLDRIVSRLAQKSDSKNKKAPFGAPTENPEEMMKSEMMVGKVLALFIFLAGVASAAAAQDKPASVAGSWTINVSGDTGNAKQSMTLAQDAGKITGTFKGPRQSGTIAGTVDGNNIKFHVTAGIPLDYTGTVDGDSMSGTMSGRGKTGDWKATRAK